MALNLGVAARVAFIIGATGFASLKKKLPIQAAMTKSPMPRLLPPTYLPLWCWRFFSTKALYFLANSTNLLMFACFGLCTQRKGDHRRIRHLGRRPSWPPSPLASLRSSCRPVRADDGAELGEAHL